MEFSTSAVSATQTLQQSLLNLTESSSNTTSSFFTNWEAKDLAFLPIQFIVKLDRFLFHTLPLAVVRAVRLDVLLNHIADLLRAPGAAPAQLAAGAMADAAVPQAVDPGATHWSDIIFSTFSGGAHRSYWGMLEYATSRWAFTCFILALILNRIGVYGSSRQRVFLTWNKRLALRIIPIMLFISQMHKLLQAIHCQSSPDFSLYRHGDNNKYSILDWSTDGGPMYTISSNLLFWSTDERSCAAVGMSRPSPEIRASYGSFSLLWPTFLRLCLSHLVESLSCSLQQISVMTEVGLSVFEHSLAFAEAETMLAHTLTSKISKLVNTTASTTTSSTTPLPTSEGSIPASGTILVITDALQAMIGPHPFNRINVPVEVLIIALISCGNCLTSHIISVLGKKQGWRLPNTTFWGLCYMSAFVWGFLSESDMVRNDGGSLRPVSALLHFPTVAIVGFLPHMAIILGIIVCSIIYMLALLLTAVSLGTNPELRRPTSLSERISIAHDNLQAAIHMRTINVRWYEDFYTALLRLGFAALTAASEAVFLNEGRAVEMRQFTWLEEERLDELDATRSVQQSDGAHFQIVEQYGIPTRPLDGRMGQTGEWKSGYEKEKKLEKQGKDQVLQDKDSFIYPNPRTDGVGAMQRTTRFYLLFIFIRGIFFTFGGWITYGLGSLLDRIGITARPRWLRSAIGRSLKQIESDRSSLQTLEENKKFDEWNSQSSKPVNSRDLDIDIEHDMRMKVGIEEHQNPEEVLDERMYNWWKDGGWYGTKDESGDFLLPSVEPDEDATSMITITTATSDNAWESEPEGQRTPTQRHQSPWSFSGLRQRRSETPTPEAPVLDNITLARLLNPADASSRDEARILSSHLTSQDRIMTRSRYQRQFEDDRAKVLLAGRSPPIPNLSGLVTAPTTSKSARQPLTQDEEAHVLEQLLLTRRTQKQRQRSSMSQHNHGLTGTATNTSSTSPEHSDQTHSGPACVVCQVEPRTIIAWPCRCLTVCEDCRVNLAMNNFGNCVTCRRTVGGFVRLYVP